MTKIKYYELAFKALHFMKPTGYGAVTIINGKAFVKAIDLFFFLLNLSIGVCMMIVSVTQMDFRATNKSIVVAYGNLLTINGAILIAIFSLINIFISRQKLVDTTMNFHHVDVKVS